MSSSSSSHLYFTPLTIGQAVTRPFRILARSAPLFLSLSALIVVPMVAVLCGSVRALQSSWTADEFDIVAWMEQHARAVAQVTVLTALVYIAVGIAVQAAMLRAVAEVYCRNNHKPTGVCVNLQAGFQKVGPILLYSLVVFFGLWAVLIAATLCLLLVSLILTLIADPGIAVIVSFVGHTAVVVLSFVLQLMLCVAVPVIVVENKTWMQAVERSYKLTKNKLLFVFCAMFLFSLVTWIAVGIYFGIVEGSLRVEQCLTTHGIILLSVPYLFVVPLSSM